MTRDVNGISSGMFGCASRFREHLQRYAAFIPTPRDIINAFNTFLRMMANERGRHALIFLSMNLRSAKLSSMSSALMFLFALAAEHDHKKKEL